MRWTSIRALGLGSLFVTSACVFFAASAPVIAASPPRILVLPLEGSAPGEERAAASAELVTALRGFEAFDVVSLLDPAAILGTRLAEALSNCKDDACRAKSLAGLGAGTMIVGSLNELAGTLRLDVRRVETTTSAASLRARATVEVARGGAGGLGPKLYGVAADLFPDEADRAFSTLVVIAEPEGARVWLDGVEVGESPIAPLRVKAGPHELRVRADGHRAESRRLELAVGETKQVELELSRVRGTLPWILGGAAAGSLVLGLVLGASASGIEGDWTEACPPGAACAAGFTRARYASDESALDTQRTLANVLFGSAVALSIGAVLGYVFDPGVEE